MGFFRKLLRLEPPRPTALELSEAHEMRLKNAKEAAARERQRLIVEWLRGPGKRLTAEEIATALDPGRPPGRKDTPITLQELLK